MQLLVTRPEPDAERTAATLRRLGHTVLVQPMLTITFAAPPAAMPEPAAIVVTSQNALRALAAWPQAAEWRGCRVFAVGPATAQAATALGFRDVRAGSGNAATLAGVVVAAMTPAVGPLLYPAARDRMGELDRRLAALGFEVTVVEAYRAEAAANLEPAVAEALTRGMLDGVLLYSRRTAEAFVAAATKAGLKPRIATPTYYVISAEVAVALAGHAEAVRVASQPNEDSLMALIPAVG